MKIFYEKLKDLSPNLILGYFEGCVLLAEGKLIYSYSVQHGIENPVLDLSNELKGNISNFGIDEKGTYLRVAKEELEEPYFYRLKLVGNGFAVEFVH